MVFEHPIGQAVRDHAAARGLTVDPGIDFGYAPGFGVTARVDLHQVRVGTTRLVPEAHAEQTGETGAVHVAIDDDYAGSITVVDTVRPSARQCVTDLVRLGIRVVMITGDNATTARTIGRELGIDEVQAELLPSDKVSAVDALTRAGHRVAMIGDGVNDAPALARAAVGIAMGSGTHIARETSDVILISSDLADLTTMIRIARRARRIVMVNFVGTLVVDLSGMVLAAFGLLGPVLAAVVHVGSESAFILNSARLIPGRRDRRNVKQDGRDHRGRP
ncbi:hypothetical protein GCM10027613_41310 [Microlunatus endophyticus]